MLCQSSETPGLLDTLDGTKILALTSCSPKTGIMPIFSLQMEETAVYITSKITQGTSAISTQQVEGLAEETLGGQGADTRLKTVRLSL